MKVLKNRQVIFDDINTQNENKVTELKLQVPSEYEDFNKKIVFITPDGIFWDLFVDNRYLIKKSITKYEQVKFYIWLTKDEQDFRSIEYKLDFYHNVDANGEITEEEINGVITVINLLEEEISKVKDLQDEITQLEEKIEQAEIKRDEKVENAVDKITDMTDSYNQNAQEKTQEYNKNAETKLNDYNENSAAKFKQYNDNADERKEEIETIADGVRDLATAIQFATFEINDDMDLVINQTEKLGNTNFSINENGELEVAING